MARWERWLDAFHQKRDRALRALTQEQPLLIEWRPLLFIEWARASTQDVNQATRRLNKSIISSSTITHYKQNEMTETWTCVHTQQSVPGRNRQRFVRLRKRPRHSVRRLHHRQKRRKARVLVSFDFRHRRVERGAVAKSTSELRPHWFFISFSGDRCTLLESVLGTPDGPPTRSDLWFRNTLVPDYVEKCLEHGAKNRENCEAVGKMLYQHRF